MAFVELDDVAENAFKKEEMVKVFYTLGQKPTFFPEIPMIWYFKNVNFVKIEILEMWILWKMRFQKCDYCEK